MTDDMVEIVICASSFIIFLVGGILSRGFVSKFFKDDKQIILSDEGEFFVIPEKVLAITVVLIMPAVAFIILMPCKVTDGSEHRFILGFAYIVIGIVGMVCGKASMFFVSKYKIAYNLSYAGNDWDTHVINISEVNSIERKKKHYLVHFKDDKKSIIIKKSELVMFPASETVRKLIEELANKVNDARVLN